MSLATSAGAVDFTELARFNLDSTSNNVNPEYIGSNPSAVAWSGSRLFVAGYNNSGGFASTAALEVLNATSTGIITTPTFSTTFNVQAVTPNIRGFLSLDVSADGNSLGMGFDDGIAGTPNGYTMWNTANLTQRWAVNERGSSGISFDPGFSGSGIGTAVGRFGSGRRLLYDTTTGTNLFDTTNGMIWTSGAGGTTVRDMDFDPDTGDIYVRHDNNLTKAVRTGGNALSNQAFLVTALQASGVSHQNVSFLSNTADGDLVIYNNRENSAAGQNFFNVIKVVSSSGAAQTANYAFLNGETPLTGAGWYDFDFHVASQTLALLDNSNRKVHIFRVGNAAPNGDFNGDSFWNCTDIDSLVMEIVAGTNNALFDLTGDALVNIQDLDQWRVVGGANNVPITNGNPFRPADANLDGVVDGSDFGVWNGNKFTSTPRWCSGDFNADGVVDGSDFGTWNANKFTSSDGGLVPEPGLGLLVLAVSLGLLSRRAW